jgi:uncharacterized protein (DUF433 family)
MDLETTGLDPRTDEIHEIRSPVRGRPVRRPGRADLEPGRLSSTHDRRLSAEHTRRNVMTMVVAAEAPPLAADAAGVFRVGNSRVTLDTVVGAFCDGATAEEIAEQYPAISLGQVYAVIAYYLAHTAEVDDYLQARERRATEVRAANERVFDPTGVRARLIARRAGQGPA